MSNPLALNYLHLGEVLRAHLAASIPEVPIEGLDEMAQVVEAQDLRPQVIYLVWSGDRFVDSLVSGPVIAYQQWTAWVRVLNASRTVQNSRSADAGPLMARVHAALAGYRPAGLARPFRRASGARPNYRPLSGLFPLTFEINLPL